MVLDLVRLPLEVFSHEALRAAEGTMRLNQVILIVSDVGCPILLIPIKHDPASGLQF